MAEESAARRRYPVRIQSFEELRKGGYLYVDKTRNIYNLAHGSGKSFYLNRPPRFGKSLLLSTIQAYFEGRRELFEGLEIEGLESEWRSFPVIRLDLSPVKATEFDQLEQIIDAVLTSLEGVWGRNERAKLPVTRLMALIESAHELTGRRVVVLVDGYDAPLLDVRHDRELLQRSREETLGLLVPLKSLDEILQFVMVTGTTKFNQTSWYGGLNNLINISLDRRYGAICGFTRAELEGQMGGDVAGLAERLGMTPSDTLARLEASYGGYRFSDESPSVCNPFSLMSALDSGELGPHWFRSCAPMFLPDLLESRDWDLAELEDRVARPFMFDAPADALFTPLAMLYQGGYVTVKSYDNQRQAYTLGIPNEEVRCGLSECLERRDTEGE